MPQGILDRGLTTYLPDGRPPPPGKSIHLSMCRRMLPAAGVETSDLGEHIGDLGRKLRRNLSPSASCSSTVMRLKATYASRRVSTTTGPARPHGAQAVPVNADAYSVYL